VVIPAPKLVARRELTRPGVDARIVSRYAPRPEALHEHAISLGVIESDKPIVVWHTRLDSRQAENALITTIAFAGDV
jgi:hypothetical protein